MYMYALASISCLWVCMHERVFVIVCMSVCMCSFVGTQRELGHLSCVVCVLEVHLYVLGVYLCQSVYTSS